MSVVTQTDALKARKLFQKHVPQLEILAAFDDRYTFQQLSQAMKDLRRQRQKFYADNYQHHSPIDSRELRINRPTAEMIERQIERQMLRPRTLTALICGDPLPGESAADRKRLTA